MPTIRKTKSVWWRYLHSGPGNLDAAPGVVGKDGVKGKRLFLLNKCDLNLGGGGGRPKIFKFGLVLLILVWTWSIYIYVVFIWLCLNS